MGDNACDSGPLGVVGRLKRLPAKGDHKRCDQSANFTELEQVGLLLGPPAQLALDFQEGLEHQRAADRDGRGRRRHPGPVEIVEHQDDVELTEIWPRPVEIDLFPLDGEPTFGRLGPPFSQAGGIPVDRHDNGAPFGCRDRMATGTAGQIKDPGTRSDQPGVAGEPIAWTLLEAENRSRRVNGQKMNPSVRATVWDLSGLEHDVLVVGGGATGAGIAREAALRGLKVALVDRYDFGGGTSSRSSRLIHGGLRYLEHRRWASVRESLAERAILLKTAPHLVRRLAFLFPGFQGDRVPRWKVEVGLTLYDLLALRGNVRRHRSLSKRAVLEHEPLLKEKGLTGGALYWDAQCDDARLTLATIRAAAAHGAMVANYACVTALDLDGGRIRGAAVEDQLTGASATVHARVVVNATGPWADQLRTLETDRNRPLIKATRGAHVMVPRSRIGHHHAITFQSPIDGRVMFILPWGDRSYIGTTDTDSSESPDHVSATEADMLYLLRSANAIFPSARLAIEDISISWAGLRPLLDPGSDDRPSDRSREHTIQDGATGLITVAGGKLTTYRRMAVEVVDHIKAKLDGRPLVVSDPIKSRTATDPLPGGDAYRTEDLFTRGVAKGLSEPSVAHLVGQFGSETQALYGLVAEWPELREPVHPFHGAVGAQVVHAVRREYARRLDDVVFRRLSLVHETPDAGLAGLDRVARLMARELGWDEERRRQEVERCRDLVAAIPMGRPLSSG